MKINVVAPVYFDVRDSYNPYMRPDDPFYGKPDRMRAMLQWSRMISILSQQMGIKINFIDPVEDLYDMAFACDPGLCIGPLFIPANFWARPREPEVKSFANWFRNRGYKIKYLSRGALFEGGDCVAVKKKLIVGFGKNRTNRRGVKELSSVLKKAGVEVVPIRRVTQKFYHLNSVLTVYPSAELLVYYPPAFEGGTGEKLKQSFSGVEIIKLGNEELFREHPDFGGEYRYSYALNAIEHKGLVIQPYCHPKHREIMEKRGLKVMVPEDGSSEFERSGGSYRCLTMMHNRS